MVKPVTFAIASLCSLQLSPLAYAEESRVSIVISRSIAPYILASEGVEEVLKLAGIQVSQLHDMAGDLVQADQIVSQLKAHPPRVVVTVGTEATQAMRQRIQDVPIVCSMVIDPEMLSTGKEPIFGASMEVSYGDQLAYLKTALSNVRRVGVLYTARRHTAQDLARRQEAAKQQQLELVLQPLQDSSELLAILRDLFNNIDALWLIPDESLLAPQTARSILLEALRYKIPVLAPSLLFVQQGALLAVSSDYKEVGRAAGELALQLASGRQPASHVIEARKPLIFLNLRTAKSLGVNVPGSLIDQAAQVVQ